MATVTLNVIVEGYREILDRGTITVNVGDSYSIQELADGAQVSFTYFSYARFANYGPYYANLTDQVVITDTTTSFYIYADYRFIPLIVTTFLDGVEYASGIYGSSAASHIYITGPLDFVKAPPGRSKVLFSSFTYLGVTHTSSQERFEVWFGDPHINVYYISLEINVSVYLNGTLYDSKSYKDSTADPGDYKRLSLILSESGASVPESATFIKAVISSTEYTEISTRVRISDGMLVAYYYVAPSWEEATPYIFHNGEWVQATPYIFHNGTWEEVSPKIYIGG